MADHTHRQAANKLRLEPELHEVALWPVAQHLFGGVQRTLLGPKADRGLAQPPLDDLFQPAKCTADDEQYVLRVDRARRFPASLVEIHHRLDLAGNVIRSEERRVGKECRS